MEPKIVTSGSTIIVTPLGSVMGAMMNALALPLEANSTACPTAQALSAACTRVVSGDVSTRLPVVCTAVSFGANGRVDRLRSQCANHP